MSRLLDMLRQAKPRVRVKAVTRMLGAGVPDDAQPGDFVSGYRVRECRVGTDRTWLHLEKLP